MIKNKYWISQTFCFIFLISIVIYSMNGIFPNDLICKTVFVQVHSTTWCVECPDETICLRVGVNPTGNVGSFLLTYTINVLLIVNANWLICKWNQKLLLHKCDWCWFFKLRWLDWIFKMPFMLLLTHNSYRNWIWYFISFNITCFTGITASLKFL